MDLSCCLLASDLNPDYLDFFPLVRVAWKEIVGIDVRLVLISHDLPESLAPFADEIHVFPPIPGLHTAFQAQCIRLLYPALLHSQPGGAVLISDIDILPMSRRYFWEPVKQLEGDKFVVYRAEIRERFGEYTIGYNAAAPTTWSEVFGGIRDEADIAEILRAWWAEAGAYEIRDGRAWFTDQIRLFSHLTAWAGAGNNERLVRLTLRKTSFRRLDRCSPEEFRRKLSRRLHLLRAGYYADYHMMQPPSEYQALNLQAATEVLRPASLADKTRAALRATILGWAGPLVKSVRSR